MMVGGGGGGRVFLNETTSSSYGITGSFPHYKQVTMPADQKAKLLAMHRASRANAGIYVAVVLAVYVILLTMLLCRYAKRQRPSEQPSVAQEEEGGERRFFSRTTHPSSSTTTNRKSGCQKGQRCSVCCPLFLRGGRGHEETEIPMTTLLHHPHLQPSVPV